MRMEAKPMGPEENSSSGSGQFEGFQSPDHQKATLEAVNQLCQAVANKKGDLICASYEALRSVGRGMKLQNLTAMADQKLKLPVMGMVVSAYSHRHCFMCSDGTATCSQCEGSGQMEEGRFCPQCDGFGIVPCGFCRGTGWGDHEAVPHEIQDAVRERHVVHVGRDIRKFVERFPEHKSIKPSDLAGMDEAGRKTVVAWMMRLQSRIADITEAGLVTDEQERAHLSSISQRIETFFDALRKASAVK